jgi:hypothetical protein
VTTDEHGTRRGGLLAHLEHACHGAGHWTVEGHKVRRFGGFWHVSRKGEPGTYVADSFTAALEYIANRI